MNRTIQPPIQEINKLKITLPRHTVLTNGIPLHIINAGTQEVVRLDFLFKGGSWHQQKPLQALFTNRMLREGTNSYSYQELAEEFDFYGAWLELSSSAEYAYVSLYSLSKFFEQTLSLLRSIIVEPTFPEEHLRKIVKNSTEQFLVNQNRVDFISHRAFLRTMYGDQHPCGKLVEKEDYLAIQSADLKDFHRRHYHSDNCVIFLSGKIGMKETDLVNHYFGESSFGKTHAEPKKLLFPIQTATEKRVHVARGGSCQQALTMGKFIVGRKHPDFLYTRVLNTLLGGYFGSRLMSNIREDKGYTYGIGSNLLHYPDSSLLTISCESDPSFTEKVIQEIYTEIDRLQNDLVGEEELRMVKNYMLGELSRNLESAFSIAEAWMFKYTSELPEDYFNRSLQAIKSCDSEKIRELAQQLICKESLKEVIAGKKTVE